MAWQVFLALGALPEAVECAERWTLKLARGENYYTNFYTNSKLLHKLTKITGQTRRNYWTNSQQLLHQLAKITTETHF